MSKHILYEYIVFSTQKSQSSKDRSVIAGSSGERKQGLAVNMYEESYWVEENTLKLTHGDECTTW